MPQRLQHLVLGVLVVVSNAAPSPSITALIEDVRVGEVIARRRS